MYPQEKVYLHFDNTMYFLGDTIWFKSYVVRAEHNRLTDLSKVLYVELLTPEGEIVETKKLKIENGQCHGEFGLKSGYFSGFYEIRAYTRYMLNWGNDNIFSRVFPIYMEPEIPGDYSQIKMMEESYRYTEKKRPLGEKLKEVNISFYPEGGNLVSGNESHVAFKTAGKNGEGLDIDGVIYDDNDNEICRFNTFHQGMGDFIFTPDYIKKYYAKIKHQGKNYTFKLPNIQTNGYTLSVDNLHADSLIVKINKAGGTADEILGLSMSCRGKVYLFDVLRFSDNQYKTANPKNNFPSGVHTLTLFNIRGEVLAERMIFVDNEQKVAVCQNVLKEYYRPFEKINLTFSVINKEGDPIYSDLSLSVKDASSSYLNIFQDNIKTNLLLSSDLKGYIENPDYYFSAQGQDKIKALDLLMMTQGWKRYEWKQIAGLEPFEIKHHVEEGLLIKGSVLSWFKKKEKEDIDVLCWLIQDGSSMRGSVKSDESGNFAFLIDSVDIYDKWQLGLQSSEKGRRKENHIVLDRFFSPELRSYYALETEVKDSLIILYDDNQEENNLSKMQILPEFVVKKRISGRRPNFFYNVERDINEMTDKRESIPARLRNYLELKDEMFAADPERCIVLTQMTTGQWSSNDFIYAHRRATRDGIIGMDGTDPTDATEIDINEIQKIEVVRDISEFIKLLDGDKEGIVTELMPQLEELGGLDDIHYIAKDIESLQKGSIGSSKTIRNIYLVHRYPNNLGKYKKGVRHTYFEGYSRVADFYNPDYTTNPVIPGDIDYRRTLYWNPNLKTDDKGIVSVSFYNNNKGRQIIVSCQGLTENGIPIVNE